LSRFLLEEYEKYEIYMRNVSDHIGPFVISELGTVVKPLYVYNSMLP